MRDEVADEVVRQLLVIVEAVVGVADRARVLLDAESQAQPVAVEELSVADQRPVAIQRADKLVQPVARDIVSHRTGLPRHDFLWYGSTATRQELYQRLVP